MSNANLPLRGVKVVELATHVAAPNVARLLADWGADVIKVESTTGDPWRTGGAIHHMPVTDDVNPMFTFSNANKRLVAINLKTEKGMEAMLKLIGGADIFITSIRKRSLAKMGLDGETLLAKFPSLVYVSFSGYGENGPEKDLPGYDSVAFWAKGGAVRDWAYKEESTFLPSSGAGDSMSGSMLTAGVLAALFGAKATGKGTEVSSSLFGSAVWYNATQIMSGQFGNVLPKEKSRPNNPFGVVYECLNDEWLFLGVPDYDGAYPHIIHALGLDELIGDERFCHMATLSEHVQEFMDILRPAFKRSSRADLIKEIRSHNIVCGPVSKINDLHNDPQALENKYIVPVTYKDGTVVDMPACPVHFSAYPDIPYEVGGKIGRDTDEVLKACGYTAEDIEEMKASGAIR